MAVTSAVKIIHEGEKRLVARLTGTSDGTGESAVTKIVMADHPSQTFGTPTSLALEKLNYSISAASKFVTLAADGATDEVLAHVSGQGEMDWTHEGGIIPDTSASGYTGDIKLTQNIGSGLTYDITMTLRKRFD